MEAKGKVEQIVEAGKSEARDAAWRTAATQARELIREPLVKALIKGGMRAKAASEFLNTEPGKAALSFVAGSALSACASDPKLDRLARELRVSSMTFVTDALAESVLGPVRSALTNVLNSLPE